MLLETSARVIGPALGELPLFSILAGDKLETWIFTEPQPIG